MSPRAYIVGLVLAVASQMANAAPIAYAEAVAPSAYTGSGGQASLYSIDLATRTATLVGPSVANPNGLVNTLFPFNMRGLSFDPAGQLYAVSEDLKVLVKINKVNGAATLVGPLNLAGPGVANASALDLSMAIACDGKAWLASGTTGNFWSVNLSTGATALLGSLGNNPITGLAAQGTTVFATGSQTNQKLFTVNTATGATTVVGAYGGTDGSVHTISPAFDATGQFLAILNDIPPPSLPAETWSNLATISQAGTLSKIGTITGPSTLQKVGLTGLAIAPPVCSALADPPETLAAPALSWYGLLGLILTLMAAAILPLRSQRRG